MKILVFGHHRTEKIADPLRAAGADFTTITSAKIHPLIRASPFIFFKLVREIRRSNPSVILSMGGDLLGFYVYLAAKITSTPLIYRLGGDNWKDLKNQETYYYSKGRFDQIIKAKFFGYLNQFLFHRATGIIVVAEHLKETLVQKNIKSNRIQVIPVPKNVSKKSISPRDQKRKKIIVTVTNLNFNGKLKGILDAFPCIARILKEDRDIQYIIAGDGIFLPELRKYINNNFLSLMESGQVKLKGFVKNVDCLYEHACIALYSSYSDGCPNVVLEAMAFGIPLIVNDSKWAREMIQNGENGIMVDISNEKILYSKIKDLLSSNEMRSKISKNAYEYVFENHNNEIVGRKLLKALDELED